ncbi:MAG: hypothetical protein IKA22_04075 [Lentisphaeria bacterium]|nr:hypothetical protein [Lentisphaeria bacterium]
MKIYNTLKKIITLSGKFLNYLYEKLPLDKMNEFLQKKSINIDLKSAKSKKILFSFLCIIIIISLFDSDESETGKTANYKYPDCTCVFNEMKKEEHPEIFTREQLVSSAGSGMFDVVKYLFDKHDGNFMDWEYTESYCAALNNGYLEIAKFIKKKGKDRIKLRKRDWFLLVSLHTSRNDGDCRTLEYILKESKGIFGTKPFRHTSGNYTENNEGDYEFNLIADTCHSICKLKTVLDTGYKVHENAIAAVLANYEMDIGVSLGMEDDKFKANRNAMQAKYYKIFTLLLKNKAQVNQYDINMLASSNKIKNKLEILYLFKKYGHKITLDANYLENIYTKEQIIENKDSILRENQNARNELLKNWESRNKRFKMTETPE